MASRPPIELTVDQKAVQKVARACRAEEDGKALRKELAADLKEAVGPGVSKVQSKLQSIPRAAAGTASSPPLGSYLASRVKPQIRLGGRSTGVAVRIPQTPNLRGFKMAARRLNRKLWRRRVFGHDVWVTQESTIPGFFDNTLTDSKPELRTAVVKALESMARRISERG